MNDLFLKRIICQISVLRIFLFLIFFRFFHHLNDFFSVRRRLHLFMKCAFKFFRLIDSEDMTLDDIDVSSIFLSEILDCWRWNIEFQNKRVSDFMHKSVLANFEGKNFQTEVVNFSDESAFVENCFSWPLQAADEFRLKMTRNDFVKHAHSNI